ncbi:MAG: ABC transporter substrate-binding protein [Frankiales bacterium]|nr:ABC transporter substrate-binding protein [Frankiales bacterium]
MGSPGAVRRRAFAAAAAGSVLVLAACGTRLPDSAFVRAQQQVGGTSAGPGGGPLPSGGVVAPSGVRPSTGASGPAGGPSSGPNPGGGGPSSQSTGGGGAHNTASDVGVTPTTITIGEIASISNPFDPRAFVGPSYGLEAFVRWTNAHGGIHGRQLVLKTCNDSGDGKANVSCVHSLIDHQHVFALVSDAVLTYSGASYVNSKAVPDVGGQPIDNAYNKYPHFWDIYGEYYPRDGTQVGFHGKLYAGTEVYRYFNSRFPKVKKIAGVVEYNQSDSQRFGDSIVQGLQRTGYKVVKKVVNFALPDYDSVAIDFRNQGVQYVYDTIDRQGNIRLCQALDDNNVKLIAKVLTTQSWEQSVETDYKSSPHCRNELWATGNTRNYADTKYPQVRDFRQQMAADGHGGSQDMSDWALEGWAGGLWFADAANSCGANLTRRCLEAYINQKKAYVGHGLLTPRVFREYATPHEPQNNCINVVRWSDAAHTWVTQVPDMDKNCYVVTEFPYSG